jgi:hypothetical protein
MCESSWACLVVGNDLDDVGSASVHVEGRGLLWHPRGESLAVKHAGQRNDYSGAHDAGRFGCAKQPTIGEQFCAALGRKN